MTRGRYGLRVRAHSSSWLKGLPSGVLTSEIPRRRVLFAKFCIHTIVHKGPARIILAGPGACPVAFCYRAGCSTCFLFYLVGAALESSMALVGATLGTSENRWH